MLKCTNSLRQLLAMGTFEHRRPFPVRPSGEGIVDQTPGHPLGATEAMLR
ncbi:hypothetical protein GTCCBUS3UF5_5130 [Geobacillus thermoleovorans CCB_US3_UF5]|uniref:Uncharacterized protein n=1 Tax=Geobacillus thermoleovorans CCB_US3_UF5 TaxID=1111068 RepID=A0ABN3ZSQ8_GEOTH|nr:hypothetical protein GTCCBUS3UF5_5130 [Geobacillus thermoleovorans CCB_US3_UF5]